MPVDHVYKVRRPDGMWVTLGTGEATGVVPEGPSMAADLLGPSSCSFTLRRPADVLWAELQAANQVQVDVDGVTVWGGRINSTPASGKGVGEQISVSAQGWREHLSDDQRPWNWVTQKMGDWRDARSFVAADLSLMVASPSVTTDQGALTIGWANGTNVADNTYVAGVYDLGPECGASHVGLEMLFTSPRSSVKLWICVVDSTNWNHGSRLNIINGVGTDTWTANTWYTLGGSVSSTRRYVHVMLGYSGAGGTWSVGDVLAKIRACRIARNNTLTPTTYQPTTTASQVITDVLGEWGCTPLLDTPQIASTPFVIPEFDPDGYRTPREIIEAVNAYHDYLWGVDALRRPYFRPRPTDPLFEVGSFSGGQFDDTSLGNLDRIYNKVIVDYTGPDGVTATVTRTNSNSILSRQGFTRAYRLAVQSTLTPAAAAQIGDVWLTKHADVPLAGSITVTPGDIRTTSGTKVHPSILLTKTGERIRLTGQLDPVTGGIGRVGTIVGATYNPQTESAQIQLDNDNQSLDAWLARLAVIQGAGK